MKAMYYPLSHPPVDDDYKVLEDLERHHASAYDYDADLEEDPVDEYDGEYWLAEDYDPADDPLRLVHQKSPAAVAATAR